jgi:hypothetical protein
MAEYLVRRMKIRRWGLATEIFICYGVMNSLSIIRSALYFHVVLPASILLLGEDDVWCSFLVFFRSVSY